MSIHETEFATASHFGAEKKITLAFAKINKIQITANVAAKLCSEFQKASLNKKDKKMQLKAQDIYKSLSPLHKALFIESNPSPVKFAASLLKLSSPDV